jgi:hypothetical protein
MKTLDTNPAFAIFSTIAGRGSRRHALGAAGVGLAWFALWFSAVSAVVRPPLRIQGEVHLTVVGRVPAKDLCKVRPNSARCALFTARR